MRDVLSGVSNMSVISQVLLKADDELRYPTTGELQTIIDFFQTGEQRLRIATTLAENEKRIVEQASKQLWQKRPDFISPGGECLRPETACPMSARLWLVYAPDYLWHPCW